MDKVASRAYTEHGRREHERIFGKRRPAYENKLKTPAEDEPKKNEYESKAL